MLFKSKSGQVATLSVRLIFAILSACGLHFRPFGLHLGLRPRYTALHAAYYAEALPLAKKMLMMRHHGDDVYRVGQKWHHFCTSHNFTKY